MSKQQGDRDMADLTNLLPHKENRASETSEFQYTESFRLESTLKIIKSNHKPNTAKSTTKPCPQVPHLHTNGCIS